MGQTLEMLLAADKSKITNIPKGKIEIKRLSKALGKPFIVEYRAGTIDEMGDISKRANGSETEEMKWGVYEFTIEPNFKDTKLHDAYDVTRPIDIVSKVLLGGEIILIYRAISKLSGLDQGNVVEVEEVKN